MRVKYLYFVIAIIIAIFLSSYNAFIPSIYVKKLDLLAVAEESLSLCVWLPSAITSVKELEGCGFGLINVIGTVEILVFAFSVNKLGITEESAHSVGCISVSVPSTV